MPSRALRGGAPLLALVFGLSACSGAPAPLPHDAQPAQGSSDGPLIGGQEATVICVPIEPGGTLTIGFDILRNGGQDEVTVTDVALIDPDGVRLTDAVLVELTGTDSLGLRDHYPPSSTELARDGLTEDWAARQPIGEAVIPAPGSGEPAAYNLVLAVESARSGSSSGGVRVEYISDGERGSLQLPTSLELRTSPDSCQMEEETASSSP